MATKYFSGSGVLFQHQLNAIMLTSSLELMKSWELSVSMRNKERDHSGEDNKREKGSKTKNLSERGGQLAKVNSWICSGKTGICKKNINVTSQAKEHRCVDDNKIFVCLVKYTRHNLMNVLKQIQHKIQDTEETQQEKIQIQA